MSKTVITSAVIGNMEMLQFQIDRIRDMVRYAHENGQAPSKDLSTVYVNETIIRLVQETLEDGSSVLEVEVVDCASIAGMKEIVKLAKGYAE